MNNKKSPKLKSDQSASTSGIILPMPSQSNRAGNKKAPKSGSTRDSDPTM